MTRPRSRLVDRVSILRWAIPIIIALIGAGYILLEQIVFDGDELSLPYVVRATLVLGVVGPFLAWLTLTWARRAALAEADAQLKLSRLVEQTRRQALQLGAASQVSQKVTAILDLDELLKEVVRLIRDTFNLYHVHLFMVHSDTNSLVLRVSSSPLNEQYTGRLSFKIGEQGITGRVAQSGQPFICNDVSREPLYIAHELLPDTRSELAIPLRLGDVVMGVLDIQSNRRNAFDEDDLVAFRTLADQVTIAIENAHLFRAMRRQFETLSALHDISLDITSHLDSQQVLDAILKNSAGLLHAQGSSLSLYNPSTDKIHVVATHNMPEHIQGLTIAPGEGVTGSVILKGEPVVVNDYHAWSGKRLVSARRDDPYDAILSVPLRWQGQVYGVLGVFDRGERRPFNEEDIRLLSLFADLASIAVKNAELYDQVVDLSHDLEQKVVDRTLELAKAREELAHKAEQLQGLLSSTIRIQEEERGRIARDLHDGSNQLLTGALFQIQAAQESLAAQRYAAIPDLLESAKGLLRDIDAENHRLIAGLRPSILDARGLGAALKWYGSVFQERYGVSCRVHISGKPIRLSPDTEIAVFRIVQESLNNAGAYAKATYINIQMDFKPARLQVSIADNGVGFDLQRALRVDSNHFGLIGMRERAESIGGRIYFQSRRGHGTEVFLELPLPQSRPETESAPVA